MNIRQFSRGFQSSKLNSKRLNGQIPILYTDQNIFLKSKPVLQQHNENQLLDSDEEKSIRKLQTTPSCSKTNFKKENQILSHQFVGDLYLGQKQIETLDKIYREVVKEEQEIKRCFKLEQYFEETVPVFQPTSKAIIVWNILVSLLVIFYFFEIPIILAWGEDFWTLILPVDAVRIFTSLSYIIFLMDIGLQFVTTFYRRGILITKKSEIAINYLQNNFVYDVVAIFAFNFRITLQSNNIAWFSLLYFAKSYPLYDISNSFEEIILLKRVSRALYQICKLMLFMFVAFNLFACFFFIIGEWSILQGYNSWLQSTSGYFGNISIMDSHEQYFYSFYFSISTMTSTMGYGDISPLNTYECTFCIGGLIFGLMIFTTFLNYNFKIFDQYNESSEQIFNARISINRFMKNNKVPQHISESVRQYLNQFWHQEGTRNLKLERNTIAQLPIQLREELMFNSYGKFLQETEMFKQNFSHSFLRALSLEIQEISFSQGETIFRDRNNQIIDENSFYFIVNGSVIINPLNRTKSPEKTYLNKLKAGQYFGEWSFFTGMNRLASVVTDSYSLMYYIKREDFLRILSRFDEDYERFCLMKDKLLIENDLSVIGVECWTCGNQSHMSTHCTLTHYRPAVQKVVNQEIDFQVNQERRAFGRFTRVNWSSRIDNSKLVELNSKMTLKVLGFHLENQQIIINRKSYPQNSIYSPMMSRGRNKSSSFDHQEINIEEFSLEKQFQTKNIDSESQIEQDLTFQNQVSQRKYQNSSSQYDQENETNNIMGMKSKFCDFEIPQIQEGLQDFDLPYNFKKYKIYENKQNLWSSNGQLLIRK